MRKVPRTFLRMKSIACIAVLSLLALTFFVACGAGVDIGAVDKILSSFGLSWPAGFDSSCLSEENIEVLVTARDNTGQIYVYSDTVSLLSTNTDVEVHPSLVELSGGLLQAEIYFENKTTELQETYIKLSGGGVTTLIEGAVLVEGSAIPAPEGVIATDGGYADKVYVQWSTVAEADSYGVYRAEAVDGSYTKLDELSGTSYDDTVASKGVTYYYKIRAYSATKGDSGFSDPDSGYKDGLDAPAVVSASDSLYYDRVEVSWTQVTSADVYYIYRADTIDGTYGSIGDTSELSYLDETAAGGVEYFYKVMASGLPYGDGGLSSPDAGMKKELGVPLGVTATDGLYYEKVVIRWGEVADVESYNVYRATSEGGSYSSLGSVGDTSFDDTTAHRGTTYYYKVSASNAEYGEGEKSTADSGWQWNFYFKDKWGSGGFDPGQFVQPRGMTIDRDNGYIYTVERNACRVQKFQLNGTYVTSWGTQGSEDGNFYYPHDVTLDSAGNVYVADSYNHRVQKFTSTGTHLLTFGSSGTGNGQFALPMGIAVDPSDGHIFVSDTNNSRVQEFDSSGVFVAKYGQEELGPINYPYSPRGIVIDGDGNFFVAAQNHHAIKKYDSNFNYVSKWGSYGSGDGQFQAPKYIEMDEQGNFYVTDDNDRVQQFTHSGGFLARWGTRGDGDGQFDTPEGVAVDSDGNVYVCDLNARVQKFGLFGYMETIGSEGASDGQFIGSPQAITVDADGYFYVTETSGASKRVQKFDPDGVFVLKWGRAGSANGEFGNPLGIAAGPDGSVYVVDQSYNRIQQFDSSGNFIRKWGNYSTADGGFHYPWDVTVDPDGYVYVSDQGNHRIQKFTSTGSFVAKWGSLGSGNGNLNTPLGIAVDRNGYVYVADSGNSRIQKFTSTGTYVTKWGSYGTGEGQFYDPRGVAVDEDGYVYVADEENDSFQKQFRVQKFAPDGTFITTWGDYGTGTGEFNYPKDLTVYCNGWVFVTDSYNYRVQKFFYSQTE